MPGPPQKGFQLGKRDAGDRGLGDDIDQGALSSAGTAVGAASYTQRSGARSPTSTTGAAFPMRDRVEDELELLPALLLSRIRRAADRQQALDRSDHLLDLRRFGPAKQFR